MTKTGTAENTAFAQGWLNSCPAVIDWREAGERISFRFDPTIEVSIVPDCIRFDSDPPPCPRCGQPLTRSVVGAMLATGKPGTGGRPRKQVPRCPCGCNTLARATARRFDCCKKAKVEK